MTRNKLILPIAFFALLILYNAPLFLNGSSGSEAWQRPLFGFLPVSIAYYIIWLALTVPFGWWLVRVTWRDAQ